MAKKKKPRSEPLVDHGAYSHLPMWMRLCTWLVAFCAILIWIVANVALHGYTRRIVMLLCVNTIFAICYYDTWKRGVARTRFGVFWREHHPIRFRLAQLFLIAFILVFNLGIWFSKEPQQQE